MSYQYREKEEFVPVEGKDASVDFPNGDIVRVTKVKGEKSGIELVNLNKYGRKGRTGFTISASAIDKMIAALQKVK